MSDQLVQTIMELIHRKEGADFRVCLEEHPELLSEECDAMLVSLSQDLVGEVSLRIVCEQLRWFLTSCRRDGLDQAVEEYANAPGLLDMLEFLNAKTPEDQRHWSKSSRAYSILRSTRILKRLSPTPATSEGSECRKPASSFMVIAADKEEARNTIAKAQIDYPGLSIARAKGFMGPAAELFDRFYQVLNEIGLPEK